ncbi:MAG TPA: ATP-binding protein, partial [Sulfuricurvum sp.]|nr:ATP-binding protein [Sulfuricurvum sp.]
DEYNDKWGHFRSVFIPQKSKDGQLYVVCADIKVDFVNEQLTKILENSIVEIVFYILILLPLFAAYFYHNRRINHMLEAEVKRRTRELKTLLDNSDQGFLSFSGDMLIHPEYSAKCKEIFGREIEGENIAEFLFGEDEIHKNTFVENIRSLIGDEDELKVENILSLLRSEFTIAKKIIIVEYRKISTETFMLILTDITEKTALENKLRTEKNKLQMIVSAVEDSNELFDLLDDYREFLGSQFELIKNNTTPCENAVRIYREVHTFKGLFAQKDFMMTPIALHKLEDKLSLILREESTTNEQIVDLLKKVDLENWLERDLSLLLQVLGENFLNKRDEIALRCEDIDSLNLKIRICAKDAKLQEEVIEKIIANVERLKAKSLYEKLSPYPKLVEKLSRNLGKHLYPMLIKCDKNIILEDAHKPFVKSLIHLFRNGVDHGIESPEERRIRGKDEMGSISCTVTATEGGWKICIQDDGMGINTPLVAKTAITKGILTQDDVDAMSAEEINLLIFHDNFSTKEVISELSGRGVGLRIVKYEMEAIGGTFSVTSRDGEGTAFSFFIPSTNRKTISASQECTELLTPVAVRTRAFLSEDIGLNLLSKDFQIVSTHILTPYPYMVQIKISGSINYLFIMGFESKMLEEIGRFFIVDAQGDTAYEFMKEQVACEVANTVLGNAITHFSNKGAGVTIMPPSMIGTGNVLLKRSHENICTTEIKTSSGLITLAFIENTNKEVTSC